MQPKAVKDFSNVFRGKSTFNVNIGGWDVSAATNVSI
jgi:hypothetical protein